MAVKTTLNSEMVSGLKEMIAETSFDLDYPDQSFPDESKGRIEILQSILTDLNKLLSAEKSFDDKAEVVSYGYVLRGVQVLAEDLDQFNKVDDWIVTSEDLIDRFDSIDFSIVDASYDPDIYPVYRKGIEYTIEKFVAAMHNELNCDINLDMSFPAIVAVDNFLSLAERISAEVA